MAAATLAAFAAAKPEDNASKPAGAADAAAAAAANWPAPLRPLHSHLPPSLQSLPVTVWLGVPLLCLTLVLFLLLRACGD